MNGLIIYVAGVATPFIGFVAYEFCVQLPSLWREDPDGYNLKTWVRPLVRFVRKLLRRPYVHVPLYKRAKR